MPYFSGSDEEISEGGAAQTAGSVASKHIAVEQRMDFQQRMLGGILSAEMGSTAEFRMKRQTISKRFGAKLLAYKEWLKSNRTLTTPEIMLNPDFPLASTAAAQSTESAREKKKNSLSPESDYASDCFSSFPAPLQHLAHPRYEANGKSGLKASS